MARNTATNPGLIVSFMSLIEDIGIFRPVADERNHAKFKDAMLNNHGLAISFPFVPDWVVWLVILGTLAYAASFYGMI
jgi:hypothetical protein